MYEIERKFLVDSSKLPTGLVGTPITQGYIFNTPNGVLRVRGYGDEYTLTVKMPTDTLRQIEIEKPLDSEEFSTLIEQATKVIVKTRFVWGRWEIDLFLNGMILAEIELDSEDEDVELPEWVTEEVTGDPRYFNSNMEGQ